MDRALFCLRLERREVFPFHDFFTFARLTALCASYTK